MIITNIKDLNTLERDKIVDILYSKLNDSQKIEKILKIISIECWESIHDSMDLDIYKNDKKIRKIGINFRYYKANGNFEDYITCYDRAMAEVYNKLKELAEINSIIDSQISAEEKLDKLQKHFTSYSSLVYFMNSCSKIINIGKKDNRLINYINLINNFPEIEDKSKQIYRDKIVNKNLAYRNKIEKILGDQKYLENYTYAEWVIKKYIYFKENNLNFNFYEEVGITEKEYKYCVKLIKFLNPVLYKELVEKTEEPKEQKIERLDTTFKTIEFGISNGFLPDGTKFDILEFIKLIPFKKSGVNFESEVRRNLKEIYGSESQIYVTINEYISKNNIKMSYIYRKDFLKSKIIIKNTIITEDIISNIFDYIELNNLPKIYKVFNIILYKYLDNEIDINNIRENKEKVEKLHQENKNPYKLTKKIR